MASYNVYARRTKTQTITAAARIYPDTPVLSYRPSFLLPSPDRQWAAYTDRSAETAWSAPCRTGYTEPFPGTLPPPAQRSGSRRLFHRDAAPPAAAPAPESSAGLTWRGQVRSTAARGQVRSPAEYRSGHCRDQVRTPTEVRSGDPQRTRHLQRSGQVIRKGQDTCRGQVRSLQRSDQVTCRGQTGSSADLICVGQIRSGRLQHPQQVTGSAAGLI